MTCVCLGPMTSIILPSLQKKILQLVYLPDVAQRSTKPCWVRKKLWYFLRSYTQNIYISCMVFSN